MNIYNYYSPYRLKVFSTWVNYWYLWNGNQFHRRTIFNKSRRWGFYCQSVFFFFFFERPDARWNLQAWMNDADSSSCFPLSKTSWFHSYAQRMKTPVSRQPVMASFRFKLVRLEPFSLNIINLRSWWSSSVWNYRKAAVGNKASCRPLRRSLNIL